MAKMSRRIAAETADQPGTPRPANEAPREPLDPAAAARARIRAAAAQEAAAEGRLGPVASLAERAARRGQGAREPFGTMEQQLQVPSIPGYSQRWFNDTPGRIERAKRAGWEHVIDPVTGQPMLRNVGRGEGSQRGLSAYLMKTPEEYYNEDQQDQQQELEQRLSDIRTGQGQGENTYVAERHRVSQGTRR